MQVELSAGVIDYTDTGGTGPVLVFQHGVVMSGTVWRKVIPELSDQCRCIVPELPLGAHRRPMREDADLSLRGIANLMGEFLEQLDLQDVTLINNDWGGTQVLIAEGRTERIGRAVITSCEAFDNYPPGIPGKLLILSTKLPGGLLLAFKSLMIRPLRRLPFLWGNMSKTKIPKNIMDAWFEPILSTKEIRRDFMKYTASLPSKDELFAIAEKAASFEKPTLIVWASEDKIMPLSHGYQLAELFPKGTLVEIANSYTLIPEDQPMLLADEIRNFVFNETC